MTRSSGPLQRVLIVGGGVAGWMAAAFLNRFLRPLGVTVTLVESVKLGTGGIGEAADPALVKFLRQLNVDELDFLQQCSATYSLGARFSSWFRDEAPSWHPHGLCGGQINDIDLFHFWLKSVQAGRDEGAYSSYSLQALLAEADKAPRAARGASPILERGEYGYHVDSAGLADFLREIATGEEVNHLFDDVRGVVRAPDGGVERVETKSGRALSADLILDCTADGEIIEKGLGDPWVSWSKLMLCDRNVALPLPRAPELHPYTRVTGLSAGWMRQAPLSHRVGSAYYYSSAHLQEDAATRELLVRATPAKASPGEPRHARLRLGRRENFWLHNCVALGPGAGLLDPVYPTDLLLTQRLLALLLELFPAAPGAPALRQAFNRRAAALYDTARDFILLHYVLARPDEAGFWHDSKALSSPASLEDLIALHDDSGVLDPTATGLFGEPAYHHVFAAAQRLPRRPCLAADYLDFDKVREIMEKMKAQNADWLERLPGHREFMDLVHRPAV